MTISLSSLISTPSVDVVGVYDTSFTQIFPNGRPIKATIKPEATFFKHPLESGATRTDHIIFNPVEISLSVLLTGEQYRNTYKNIKSAFKDQTQLIVQTRTDSYENMYIQGMPHDETPDTYDAVIVSIMLTETQIASTSVSFLPSSQSDTDTKKRGQQAPSAATESQQSRGSTLYRVFK